MNKASKKVENEEMKNKLNDEIDVENMEIANLIKKDSEDIPKISTDINVINQIRTTGRKNKNKMIIRLCTGVAACLVLVVGTVFWYRTNTENKARELASRTVHVAKTMNQEWHLLMMKYTKQCQKKLQIIAIHIELRQQQKVVVLTAPCPVMA